MQTFADRVIVKRILWNFPGGICSSDQYIVAVGNAVYHQILAQKVGSVDVCPSSRYTHGHVVRTENGEMLGFIPKVLFNVGKTETRLGTGYGKAPVGTDEPVLVEFSHVKMVMGEVIVEEVWSIEGSSGNEIFVSNIFGDKVET